MRAGHEDQEPFWKGVDPQVSKSLTFKLEIVIKSLIFNNFREVFFQIHKSYTKRSGKRPFIVSSFAYLIKLTCNLTVLTYLMFFNPLK